MEALQHMTSKQSQTGQNPGESTQVPQSTFSMAGGITTRATIKSDRKRDTRKQFDVQRNERWANTSPINRMFPQAVTRIMRDIMTARSHGPLPLMLRSTPSANEKVESFIVQPHLRRPVSSVVFQPHGDKVAKQTSPIYLVQKVCRSHASQVSSDGMLHL